MEQPNRIIIEEVSMTEQSKEETREQGKLLRLKAGYVQHTSLILPNTTQILNVLIKKPLISQCCFRVFLALKSKEGIFGTVIS